MNEEKTTTQDSTTKDSKPANIVTKIVGYALLGLLAATLIGAILAKH
jgi:hypothetical protein